MDQPRRVHPGRRLSEKRARAIPWHRRFILRLCHRDLLPQESVHRMDRIGTYIQKEGINRDYGVYDAPDDFYDKYGANLNGIKRFFFKHIVRKWMNGNISRIRRKEWK